MPQRFLTFAPAADGLTQPILACTPMDISLNELDQFLKQPKAEQRATFAKVLRAAKTSEDREKICRRWAEVQPTEVEPHFLLGEILRQRGEIDKALTAYEAVLSIDTTHLAAAGRRADCLFEIGQLSKALAAYSRLANQPAPPPWALIGAANAAEKLELHQAAVDYTLKLLSDESQGTQANIRRLLNNYYHLDTDLRREVLPQVLPWAEIAATKLPSHIKRLLEDEYQELNSDAPGDAGSIGAHFLIYGVPEQRRISRLFDPEYLCEFALSQGVDLSIQHHCEVVYATSHEVMPCCALNADYIRKANPEHKYASPAELVDSIIRGTLVNVHPLFDDTFYVALAKNHGLEVKGSPFLHYIRFGWKIGIDPHPLFDGRFYLADIQDVRLAHFDNPLFHFSKQSGNSTLNPSPFLDLQVIRHNLSLNGITYSSDLQLLIDAADDVSIQMHPHITEEVVSFISTSKLKGIDSKNKLFDAYTKLISDLRLGHFSPASSSKAATETEFATVSVVIVNYKKPILTLLSVISALRSDYSEDIEVIIVDNGSQSFEKEILYRYTENIKNIKIISNIENRYFGEGNNLGIDAAGGKYVLLLNNDAFLQKSTIRQLIDRLSDNDAIGAVAPILLLPTGQIQEIGGSVFRGGEVVQHDKFLSFQDYEESHPLATRHPVSVDYVSAACMMTTRTVLNKVLGFDLVFDPLY